MNFFFIIIIVLLSINEGYSQEYHTIQKNETLADISKLYYGSSDYWIAIYDANKNLIPDPDHLAVGITIKIPQLISSEKNLIDNKLGVETDDKSNITGIFNIEKKSENDIDCSFYEGLTGTLKKIVYENDEITITGIIIEEEFGKRTYINVDGENLKNMSIVDYSNLPSILRHDSLLIIDCNMCGSSPFIYAVNIRNVNK